MTRGEAMALGVGVWITAVLWAGIVHIDQGNQTRSRIAQADRKSVHAENAAILANQRAAAAKLGYVWTAPIYPPKS